ncbi:MAG: DNA helicase, partial [Actinobacteria bacterium]|nr:DNA helicase [Actinomycetota bacterium]
MAANYGTMLLNKVINGNAVRELDKHRITEDSFISEADKKAYRYIVDYSEENNGEAPSYATVAEEIPDFFYIPSVTDSFAFITEKVRKTRGEVDYMRTMENEIPKLYDAYQSGEVTFSGMLEKVENTLEDIRDKSTQSKSIGIDLKRDTDKVKEEYRKRQLGESFKIWKSFMPFLNESTSGGYSTGNMYTIYGRSGRGKSVISLYECAYIATQGANVLIWSLEMSWYETIARLYTFLS